MNSDFKKSERADPAPDTEWCECDIEDLIGLDREHATDAVLALLNGSCLRPEQALRATADALAIQFCLACPRPRRSLGSLMTLVQDSFEQWQDLFEEDGL